MTTESRTPPDPLPPVRRRRRGCRGWTSWAPHGALLISVTWFGHEFVLLPTILFVLALVSFGLCLVGTVLALPAAVVAFWPWLAGAMEYPLVRAAAVAGLALFAVFLYVLRHAKRITYGYCEVGVGIVGLWAALSRLDAEPDGRRSGDRGQRLRHRPGGW